MDAYFAQLCMRVNRVKGGERAWILLSFLIGSSERIKGANEHRIIYVVGVEVTDWKDRSNIANIKGNELVPRYK